MQIFQQTGLVSFMQRIIWMDELSLEAQCHMIISMFARHFHLYVRGTLLVVEVSGAIWVSWYLGQSQTDKNTESTATPPTTNTQWWLFCSSMLLQICQRTNKKEHPHSNSSKSKCSLLCEFLFSDLQAMKKKIGPSLFNLSTWMSNFCVFRDNLIFIMFGGSFCQERS